MRTTKYTLYIALTGVLWGVYRGIVNKFGNNDTETTVADWCIPPEKKQNKTNTVYLTAIREVSLPLLNIQRISWNTVFHYIKNNKRK